MLFYWTFWIPGCFVWLILLILYGFLFITLIQTSKLLQTWIPTLGRVIEIETKITQDTEDGKDKKEYYLKFEYDGKLIAHHKEINKKLEEYLRNHQEFVLYVDPSNHETYKFGYKIGTDGGAIALVAVALFFIPPIAMSLPPGPIFFAFIASIDSFLFVDVLVYMLIFLSPNVLLLVVYVITLACSPLNGAKNLNRVKGSSAV